MKRASFILPSTMPTGTKGHDGTRLHLSWSDCGNAILAEETVLPEKLMVEVPNRLDVDNEIHLTTKEARWLLTCLTELVPAMEESLAKAEAELAARKAK